MIKRIRLLTQLPGNLARIVLGYYLKRSLRLECTPTEAHAIHVFGYAFEYDATVMEWNNASCTIDFSRARFGVVVLRHPPSSDWQVFYQVFVSRQYDPVVATYREKFANGTDNLSILDAGANIGLATIAFKTAFERAEILCVEPDQSNVAQLHRTIGLNGYQKVSVTSVGLWGHDGYLRFDRSFRDGKEWSVKVEEASEQDHDLQARSVGSLLSEWKRDRLDILKMDVEGAEKAVFGDEAELDYLSNVRVIAIEIHDEMDCRESILSKLRTFGFDHQQFGELTIGWNTKLIEGNDRL